MSNLNKEHDLSFQEWKRANHLEISNLYWKSMGIGISVSFVLCAIVLALDSKFNFLMPFLASLQ